MIELKFTPQQLQVLNEALIRLPYGMVAELIQEINIQLQQQQMQKNAENSSMESTDGCN